MKEIKRIYDEITYVELLKKLNECMKEIKRIYDERTSVES
jgi:hypothetical protein